jgi:NADPH:quinone reductase-like Zn-dependent oxidoreductase
VWRCRPGHRRVGIATPPADADARRYQARGVYFIVEPDATALAELARLADAGSLRPSVGRVFPLADAAGAFDALEHQHLRGKIVLSARPERPWAGNT